MTRRGILHPVALASAYLALMPIAWPVLPLNIHVSDLLLPVLAISVVWHWRRHGALSSLDYWVAVYLLALLVPLAASDDVAASAVEFLKRASLVVLYAVFAVVFARDERKRTLKTLVATAIVICAAGVIAAMAYYVTGADLGAAGNPAPMPYLGTVLRLRMFTESPAMLANYLTFVLPFLCALVLTGTIGRGMCAAALGLMCLVMGLTFSHGLAGFAVAALAIAWPLLKPYRFTRAIALASVLVLVLVINAALVVTVRRVDTQHRFDTAVPAVTYAYAFQGDLGAEQVDVRVSYNLMSYYLLKKAAFTAFLERPWTGVGLGRFEQVTGRAVGQGDLHEPYRVADPHSTLFGALAETGILATAATFGLLAAGLLAVRRLGAADAPRWWVSASAIALLGLIVNSINTDIMNFRFLWVGLAALRAAHSGPPAAG